MSDIEQVKTNVVNAAAAVKADATKVVSAVNSLDVDAQKAKQAALARLNKEEGWIERNPGKVTLIGIVLFVAIIVMVVKGCA